MHAKPRLFTQLVAVSCVALVALQLLSQPLPAALAKLLASSAFIAIAVSAGAATSGYGRLILAGLVFSWLGDMLLVGEGQGLFLAGLLAFLLAHVAYVGAFTLHGVDGRWLLFAALPVIAVAALVTIWLTPHVAPFMMVPVRVYTVVISLMVVMAFGALGAGGSRLMVAGALLFFVSDLSVAALRIVQTEWPTYVVGLPLYYAGQVLLALSTGSQSRSHSGTPEKYAAR